MRKFFKEEYLRLFARANGASFSRYIILILVGILVLGLVDQVSIETVALLSNYRLHELI